jgi:hypothetical protein
MNFQSINSDIELSKYSVSRLKLYDTCSEQYRLKYIEGIVESNLNQSNVLGNICHSVLEEYFKAEFKNSVIEILERDIKDILIDLKVLPNSLDSVVNGIVEDIKDYQKNIYHLYIRASADYKGSDAIRTKSGAVPSNPSMTSAWKSYVKRMNLDSVKSNIALSLYAVNPSIPELDLVDIYCEAFNILSKYTVPPCIINTECIELSLSAFNSSTGEIVNPVFFPQEYAEEPVLLNGYVDWIGEVQVGFDKGIAIIDYKTSKEKFTESTVSYNVQLYCYVYAYENISNKTVSFIGIHALRTNELVIVKIDRQKMNIVLDSLFSKHKYIKNEQFKKRVPDSIYSPCLNQFGKECSYLKYCYPDVFMERESN